MGVINSARTRQQMLHAQTFHSDALLTQEDAAAAGDRRPAPDTWIYPLVQMKPFEIQIDEIVTETLLTEAERGAKVYLTTGYFNLTQAYMDLVLGTRAEYQILLASPEVNGFFGAKGVAGAIPAAYVHIERQFYSAVCSLGQQERVRLQEYCRRGWTFHAKGRQRRPEGRAPTGSLGGRGRRGNAPQPWPPVSAPGVRCLPLRALPLLWFCLHHSPAGTSHLSCSSAFLLCKVSPLCSPDLQTHIARVALLKQVHIAALCR